jgi:hypothetical protein
MLESVPARERERKKKKQGPIKAELNTVRIVVFLLLFKPENVCYALLIAVSKSFLSCRLVISLARRFGFAFLLGDAFLVFG